ncbi:MAG: hypothetical protein WCK35_21770 [Chloroflexota bacterium]
MLGLQISGLQKQSGVRRAGEWAVYNMMTVPTSENASRATYPSAGMISRRARSSQSSSASGYYDNYAKCNILCEYRPCGVFESRDDQRGHLFSQHNNISNKNFTNITISHTDHPILPFSNFSPNDLRRS